jgi:3-phenylpropionate/cinnamic acid dioxygenase small subunit
VTLRERVADAYCLEADLLDRHDLKGWLDWVTEGFRYEVPIPVIRAGDPTRTHSDTGLLSVETTESIRLWARRLTPEVLDSAYSENPPARTRHFVTNIRVEAGEDGRLRATSNVLLTWCRWNDEPRLLSAARHDVLIDDGERLWLDERRVLLDAGVVQLGHLRVII